MNINESKRTKELMHQIMDVCNNHVVKHKDDLASIEIVNALANLTGIYANILHAPDDSFDVLIRNIKYIRKSDLSFADVRNLAKYQ